MGSNREPYSDNLGEQLSPLVLTKNRLKNAGIIAILRGQNPSKLFDRGIALAKIGYTAIEVSLDSKDALQIIQRLRNMCAGIHIMAPGWETNIPMLVERSGLTI